MSKSEIGTRMKNNYENVTRYYLPKRSHQIVRIDGKAFKSYTRKLQKPFDKGFVDDMKFTASDLCKEIQGARLAYVQSDEISILFDDLRGIESQLWFDGNIQKIASITASIATAKFNKYRNLRGYNELATFDSRVFSIPDKYEVMNYFIWRQKDYIRNSVSAFARSFFSTKQLYKKSTVDMIVMCLESGEDRDWDRLDWELRYGNAVHRLSSGKWYIEPAPVFTEEKDFLNNFVK